MSGITLNTGHEFKDHDSSSGTLLTPKVKAINRTENKKKKSKNNSKSGGIGKCKVLLHDLLTAKVHEDYAFIFREPVDAETCGVSNYYEVIKNPMDLSTMQQKMNNGEYKSPWDFEKDMRLIINNCQEFNVGNSEILDMCSKFQQVFEERFNRIIKPRDPNELLRKEGDSFCARTSFNFDTTFPNDKNWILKELKKTQKYTMKLVEKLTEIHDIEDSIDVDKLLEDQVMTELKFRKKKRSHNSTGNIKHGVESKPVARNRKSVSQVNPFNQVKTVAPPEPENPEPPLPMSCSSDDEDIYEPMTEDEKYLLVRDISNLPYETLQKVIKFMKNLQPQSFCQNVNQNDLNLDVDFEKFSTKTLRKTEKFVHDIKHPKVARAVPFPRKEKLENNPKLVEELKKKLDDEQKQCESKLINLKQMLGAHFQKEMTKNAAPSEKDSSDDSSDGSSSSSSSSSSSDSGSSDSE